MRSVLRSSIILIAALFARPALLAAQAEEDQGPATLTLCNKGNRPVSVAVGATDYDPAAPALTVSGWTTVTPGECNAVYDFQHTAYVPVTAYVAFAYFDSPGRFVAARMTALPDIGAWVHHSTFMALRYPAGHGPALTRAAKTLCVNAGPLEYSIPRDSKASCAGLHPEGVKGPLVPIVAQAFFHPSARRCSRNASYEELRCGGGRYYLDVEPRSGDLELRAKHGEHEEESVAVQRTPEENARELATATKEAVDVARKLVTTGKLEPAGTPEASSWDEVRPLFWKGAMQSVGTFQPGWVGKVVTVRGTVSRVNERPMWMTLSFKESPRDAVVLCAMWANALRRALGGVELAELVGKEVEFTGQVEKFEPCSAGATIRVLEPEQIRMGRER